MSCPFFPLPPPDTPMPPLQLLGKAARKQGRVGPENSPYPASSAWLLENGAAGTCNIDGPYGSVGMDVTTPKALLLISGQCNASPAGQCSSTGTRAISSVPLMSKPLNPLPVPRLCAEGHPKAVSDGPLYCLPAGGVGVTPMMSIAEHILAIRTGPKPHVHFMWTARGDDVLSSWCGPLMMSMAKAPNFTLHLHNSKASSARPLSCDPEGQVMVQHGRAQIDSMSLTALSGLQYNAQQLPGGRLQANQVAVLVCGPNEMVQQATRLAATYGYHLHTETFEW